MPLLVMVSIITNRVTRAAFVNWDQVLGGGCNWEIADMPKKHKYL